MRVLVAMSGGVDSSVAAYLLVQQGYEVIGATMQVCDYSSCSIAEGIGTCCSHSDVDDARSVADTLGIPFYVINCEAEFQQKVITPFVESYLKGQTPLPCSDCNTFLKFDYLIQKMKELECDYLATGHYAQIHQDSSSVYPQLTVSQDLWKDQSYFLFTLPKKVLPHLQFPVGHLDKKQVRAIAEKAGLVVARKKDSTGICFVGQGSYSKFVESQVSQERLEKQKGVIRRYPQGEIMAPHSGIHHFTIGQSRGLGMTHHEKLFVIKIDPKTSDVWVGEEEFLFRSTMSIHRVSWLVNEEPLGVPLTLKIRSTHQGAEGQIFKAQDSHEGIPLEGLYHVHFKEPQRAITPGQAAVFYQGHQLLGGGWIL
jgi:tRNA-uridine 2-sulfurtransferase